MVVRAHAAGIIERTYTYKHVCCDRSAGVHAAVVVASLSSPLAPCSTHEPISICVCWDSPLIGEWRYAQSRWERIACGFWMHLSAKICHIQCYKTDTHKHTHTFAVAIVRKSLNRRSISLILLIPHVTGTVGSPGRSVGRTMRASSTREILFDTNVDQTRALRALYGTVWTRALWVRVNGAYYRQHVFTAINEHNVLMLWFVWNNTCNHQCCGLYVVCY